MEGYMVKQYGLQIEFYSQLFTNEAFSPLRKLY